MFFGVEMEQKIVREDAITEFTPNAFERKERHDENWGEGSGANKYRSVPNQLAP
jgi:hypothetical protein